MPKFRMGHLCKIEILYCEFSPFARFLLKKYIFMALAYYLYLQKPSVKPLQALLRHSLGMKAVVYLNLEWATHVKLRYYTLKLLHLRAFC